MMMQQTLASGAEQFVPPVDFVQRLQQLAEYRGTETALIVVGMEQGEAVEKVFSYTAIWHSVRALAAVLQKTVPAGERALLLLDNDEHYVLSLFACFAAGVIAVPVFPPESNRPQHLKRLTGIASDAQASVILATSRLASLLPDVAQQLGAQQFIQVDQVDEQEASQWQAQYPQQSDIAFLQYTSGSTSAPKGVMVTHACLMANEAAIRYGLSIRSHDCFGVWSPLFHDMGLIGGLLQPFYSGIPCVLCSPQYFTASPLRWLQLIDRYRISISGGPDFAYRLCLDRIKLEDCRHLDLSHWRVAYTGAEPVRHDTMRDFVDRFSACGFAAQAVYPCYGLAEATLYITGGQRGAGMRTQAFSASMLGQGRAQADSGGTVLVACGQTAPEHTVCIVNPQSLEREMGDGIGEIWASGPSIAAGYWRNPQASAQTFVTDKSGTCWLRTGDLGFQYQDQLFIAGRLKDMIIVRGHNVYPQDLEQRIEMDVGAVRKGRVAAFAVDVEGKEGVGIAAEVSRVVQKRVSPHELAQQIADALGPYLGEAPKVIALLNGSGMPKTSSGKLQRQACRAQWQQDTLDAYAVFVNGHLITRTQQGQERTVSSSTASEQDRAIHQALAEFWAELLGVSSGSEFVPESHFFMLGGNSLSAAQLAMRVSAHYQIVFQPRDVFSHPGLAAMSQAIRLRQQDQTRAVTPIPRLDEQTRALAQPLSQEQSSQWFLWKLDPTSTAYHVQGAMQIDGDLDLALFKQAVEQLVQRHGVLRTGFEVQADGQIRQRLQQTSTIALEYRQSDGTGLQTSEQIIQDFCARPFDLLAGPARRALLIRQSVQQHVLVLVMHHIISDAASMQILLDDLGALYAALQGKGAEPDAPVLHYVDYAAWQSSTKAADHTVALAYWQKTLGSEHPVLALPYDFPAQVAATRQAAHHDVAIDSPFSEQLRQLAGRVGATPFVVLMAALHTMLHRYTGQASIRLGVPVSLRDQAGLEGMAGFLANTVVLQQSFQPSLTLMQLLEQARDSHQHALAHADLPFEQLVQTLRPDRSSGVNPLFQVMFNYLHEDFSAFARHTGLKAHVWPLEAQQAQFELSLEVRENPAYGMHLRFSYDRARFSAQTVRRMAEHYQMILQAMLSQVDILMAELPLLAEQERIQVMSWGTGPLADSVALPVHRLFEQQAAASPGAPALIVDDVVVSYETLNAHANRLAHALIAQGLGADQLVGIALERSLDMVVSLLAVLKAGAAYVPLDPDYPAQRLAHMVQDSDLRWVLTHQGLRHVLPASEQRRVVELDQFDTQNQPEHNPDVAVHEEQLAYLIYTSGSTGLPKGVAVRHRGLSLCMAWMQHAYALGADDTVLHKAPFSFDVSCWEIFWPLSQGVRLVIASPGDHRDPQRIFELIERYQITTVNFVPAMLQAFLSHCGDRVPSLRHVMCGGEAISSAVQSLSVQRLGAGVLQNLYGPTETTIHVTRWTCVDDGRTPVPIGQPIDQTQAYVLDGALNLVPSGVEGELYIGGDLLARGYENRAELTAERFVADPFSANGGRLYRTGDLVRWNEEGQLEYLGRLDHQVKVRGFRIELGEIENQLLSLEGVREAVVVARPGPQGMQLVGYVSGAASGLTLRDQLSSQLPDYMVPSVIMVLEALPLNANGKIDRKALPEPEFVSAQRYEAPQGELESTLSALWSQVLGVEQVGRQANFFDLGGHSLLLVQLHEQMAKTLHTKVSVMDLFRYPTVQAQADFIRRAQTATPDEEERASIGAQAQRRKQALLRRKQLVQQG